MINTTGSFTPSGTLVFSPGDDSSDETYDITSPAPLNLSNLTFGGSAIHASGWHYVLHQPLVLAGDLNFASSNSYTYFDSGSISVAGNVTATSGASGGAGSVTLNGVNQTLNVAAGNTLPTGAFTLASSGSSPYGGTVNP